MGHPAVSGSVAGWNGTSFFPIGKGGDASTILYSTEEFNGDLYFGGLMFTMTNSDNSTLSPGGLVKWDGVNFSIPTNSGLTGFNYVFALKNIEGSLYVGGQFSAGTNRPSANIIRTDGTDWYAVGKGVNGRVYDIEKSGADLYLCGGFTQATNDDDSVVDAFRLVRWDGSRWQSMGVFNDTVRTVLARGSELYVGGDFTDVDGITARHVACFDGTQWNSMGEGTEGLEFTNNGQVYDLASDGNALWITGRFTHAGGVPASNVTRWTFCTPEPPTFVGGGTGASVEGTSITFSWDATSGSSTKSVAATSYDLQISSGNSFDSIVVDESNISSNSYTATNLSENTTYSWRIRAVVDASEGAWSPRESVTTGVATDIIELDNNLPHSFSLSQNYPNPFNPTTDINFAIPKKSNVTLTVYNMLGKKVKTLVNENMAAGNYSVSWDGTNSNGEQVSSGIYLYKIVTDLNSSSKKMVLLK